MSDNMPSSFSPPLPIPKRATDNQPNYRVPAWADFDIDDENVISSDRMGVAGSSETNHSNRSAKTRRRLSHKAMAKLERSKCQPRMMTGGASGSNDNPPNAGGNQPAADGANGVGGYREVGQLRLPHDPDERHQARRDTDRRLGTPARATRQCSPNETNRCRSTRSGALESSCRTWKGVFGTLMEPNNRLVLAEPHRSHPTGSASRGHLRPPERPEPLDDHPNPKRHARQQNQVDQRAVAHLRHPTLVAHSRRSPPWQSVETWDRQPKQNDPTAPTDPVEPTPPVAAG